MHVCKHCCGMAASSGAFDCYQEGVLEKLSDADDVLQLHAGRAVRIADDNVDGHVELAVVGRRADI